MKRWIVVALLAVGVGGAATTAAAEESCSLIGSWYGYYSPPTTPMWMTTVSGKSESSGDIVLEVAGFDVALGGYYPTAVGGTTYRGVWKRINGRTFAVTVYMLAWDQARRLVYVMKGYGTDTLSDDCNSYEVAITFEILDPYTFEPLPPLNFPLPRPAHHGYRIGVEPSLELMSQQQHP